MHNIALVDLASQHHDLRTEILDAVSRVVDSGQFILGDDVTSFEQEFASYCGVSHCVGVASGTDALHLALRALDIGPGDEVITAANTFVATVFAIRHVGAEPVLVDVEEDGYNLDVGLLEAAITPRTKAIIPVHLYGHPARMNEVASIARAQGLKVVEDASQAHGAKLHGRPVGSLGDVACFSFYPGKNLGALGDGGAVVTNDAEVVERIRVLRNCGQSQKNVHPVIGYNSRLDTLQAGILRLKLAHLDAWNDRRRAAARRYDELLATAGVALPSEQPGGHHVFHLYVVRHPRRDEVLAGMGQRGIACGVHYPKAVHEHPPFHHLRTVPDGAPLAVERSRELLSLPMSPHLTSEQVEIVASTLKGLGPY